jgi:radical SAM modification target selenobiotic family peptide
LIYGYNDQFLQKEGKMEKKHLKKVLKGLSIAGLVAGMTGVAMGAGG